MVKSFFAKHKNREIPTQLENMKPLLLKSDHLSPKNKNRQTCYTCVLLFVDLVVQSRTSKTIQTKAAKCNTAGLA
jgi:hypothetical protein